MRLKNKSLLKFAVIVMAAYCIILTGVYYLGGDSFQYGNLELGSFGGFPGDANNIVLGELPSGSWVEQTFVSESDSIEYLSLWFGTFGRLNAGTVTVNLFAVGDDAPLLTKTFPASDLPDNQEMQFKTDVPVSHVLGKEFRIRVSTEGAQPGSAASLYYHPDKTDVIVADGRQVAGTLIFSVMGRNRYFVCRHYLPVFGGLGVLLLLYLARLIYLDSKGKSCLGLGIYRSFRRYGFLLQQLVSRDFKTKYKRSVLGVLWSFLNPLLTMLVQYVVFSTIFKSEIENFPVYLLTGIILFNFFSEATGMGLSSIVGSSSLITKVYIPKYIFPVSRVLSSSINLLISLVPLLLAVLVTRVRLTWALLLLPYGIVCVIVFCIGLSMLLSSAMVFFRDVQFLWNVLSMLWMYATPIFYPESIIPQNFMFFYRLNPLYHIIGFCRTVILEGVSPSIKVYFFCALAAVASLVAGALVMKKTQDRFVLYI